MSSLYIHIPFCKQACHYCDFHFSTNLKLKDEIVEAICQEIALQQNYLSSKDLKSIYFGGGTPSLLSAQQLDLIFQAIAQFYNFNKHTEITLEANPDDLTDEKLITIQNSPINRLSIGIQTFSKQYLQFLNRAHNDIEASTCVQKAQDKGIENISIDLIYGIPTSNHDIWLKDLKTAFELNVQHLSAYCLTIEPQTVFGNWQKKNKISTDDEFGAEQFEILVEQINQNGFVHYETSNFGKPHFFSQHNTNYWIKGDYLGVGPSAHSYNFTTRQFNVAHNAKYLKSIKDGIVPAQKETLTWKDQANEYLMTSLRTIWGTDLGKLQSICSCSFWDLQGEIIKKNEQLGLLFIEKNTLKLTSKGKLLADQIAADLFIL